jgi:hypothetical protein
VSDDRRLRDLVLETLRTLASADEQLDYERNVSARRHHRGIDLRLVR